MIGLLLSLFDLVCHTESTRQDFQYPTVRAETKDISIKSKLYGPIILILNVAAHTISIPLLGLT